MNTINKEWQALLEDQFTGVFNNDKTEQFVKMMTNIQPEGPSGTECRLWARAFALGNGLKLEFPNEHGIDWRLTELEEQAFSIAVNEKWEEMFGEEVA